MFTVQNTIDFLKTELDSIFSQNEKESVIRIIAEEVLFLTKTEIVLHRNQLIAPEKFDEIRKIVERLQSHEPIQYILGFTYFYSGKFSVSPEVLIPRPETEELVDIIVKENPNQNMRILDIGTGSGCIAISLAQNIPQSQVCGVDISENALQIARKNGEYLKNISFKPLDILNVGNAFNEEKFDIFVSNPPYVLNKEKSKMDKNVLDYEPHSALFVPDNIPLIFYEKIIEFCGISLKSGGKLYFEINENFGNKILDLLTGCGFFIFTEIRKDLSGKDRFSVAVKK